MARDDPARMPVEDGGMFEVPEVRHTESVGEGSEWDPDLAETLYELLYLSDIEDQELGSELEKLEQRYEGAVYSELIHLLSHLRFEPEEAKQHWKRILAHRDSMQERLGTSIDLRVALVSYFVQVNRKLKNPKVIELKLFEETRASAYRDELTGLQNYRSFSESLPREILRCERYSTPLSLVMVDIDDFKNYNDGTGHEAGNKALATIAGLLAEAVRKIDVAARYGGEEFALILPMTPKIGAQKVAERARETIEQHIFPQEHTQPGGMLTVSMGVATFPTDATGAGSLVRSADLAMYFAKARGKNQVQLYRQSRRSYRRIRASLKGEFRVLAGDRHTMRTVNLSEGGLCFLTDLDLRVGSLIDINLVLPESSKEFVTAGRVTHMTKNEDGEFEAAVRFVDMERENRFLLTEYVRRVGLSSGPLDSGDPE